MKTVFIFAVIKLAKHNFENPKALRASRANSRGQKGLQLKEGLVFE